MKGEREVIFEEEDLLAVLRGALFRHPVAAQAAIRALVAEGRAYARTEEGEALARQLEDSSGVNRLRSLWHLTTANAIDGDDEAMIPTAVVEGIASLLARGRPEELL